LEIAPVPHRASRSEWRRLALGLTVLVPVVLLVLLPAVLGLDRFVVTDRATDGAPGRGSVVLAREVLPSDLRAGDVITFRPPGGSPDERVARRIISISDDVATTRAGSTGRTDTWSVPLTAPTYPRVWLGIPWIGYPFLLGGGWLVLAVAAVLTLGLAVAAGRRQPQPATRPARARLPVG
jgi:signal peptidase I